MISGVKFRMGDIDTLSGGPPALGMGRDRVAGGSGRRMERGDGGLSLTAFLATS